MHFSCLQENLIYGLDIVSHLATSSKSGLAILENILLKAEKGSLSLSSTNLEMAITTTVRAKVEEQGSFTVPAKLFTDYISTLPGETLDIKLNKNQLTIKGKKKQAKVKGVSADEFPIIPQLEKESKYSVSVRQLQEALDSTLFAISPSETRAEISGALLIFNYPKKKILTVVGTDSYRLAKKEISLEEAPDQEKKQVIVPLKTLREASRIAGEEKNIDLYLSQNQILFTYQDSELISRIINGDYPDYQQIIPEKTNTDILVEKEEFLQVVKAASLFAQENINDVKIEVLADKGKLVISSVNDKLGEQKSELEADISGKPCQITFNYRYLLDGLTNLTNKEIRLKIVDNNSPALVEDKKDPSYLYLIMPIQPQEGV